jgi:HK97 family phage portal protein
VPRAPVRFFGIKVPGFTYDISISDPAFAAMLQIGGFGLGSYSLYTALQSPAFYRGVALISGTIASLPLKTYRNINTGEVDDEGDPIMKREEASSFLDTTPSGPYGLTSFSWRELIVFCLVSEGEVGLIHVDNAAGSLMGLMPVHPTTYTVKWVKEGDVVRKQFMVQGESVPRYDDSFTQILGLSLDGMRGVSPVILFQRGIQLSAAMEIAAMSTMAKGMHVSGIASAKDEDIDEDDAKIIKAGIDSKVSGPDNAGGIAFVNKRITFTPWIQTNNDAQFIQSREFQVIEVARMLGLPPHLLGSTEKQTSWGTGISEQNSALHRYTLMPITSRIEEALSQLLSAPKFVEFDYHGLLQGTPAEEHNQLIALVDGGIMTPNEARGVMNLPPLPGGETFKLPAPPPPIVKQTKIPGEGAIN